MRAAARHPAPSPMRSRSPTTVFAAEHDARAVGPASHLPVLSVAATKRAEELVAPNRGRSKAQRSRSVLSTTYAAAGAFRPRSSVNRTYLDAVAFATTLGSRNQFFIRTLVQRTDQHRSFGTRPTPRASCSAGKHLSAIANARARSCARCAHLLHGARQLAFTTSSPRCRKCPAADLQADRA